MDFIRGLLRRNEKKSESAVLIDIAMDSVAGAYAHYREGELPTILYTRRFALEIRTGEPHEQAIARALGILGDELIREGAPILMRHTGNGSADAIFVSFDTPWKETKISVENFERRDPFVFTKNIVTTTLEKTRTLPRGKILADESVIAAVLNGYETHEPYGKTVRRASVTVLSSFIDAETAESVIALLRGLYHTKNIKLISSSSLRYQAMQKAFPHERKSEASSLEQMLDAANSGNLWLAGNPPKVVPVLASHLSGLVRQTATTPPDLNLLLMALFFQPHSF